MRSPTPRWLTYLIGGKPSQDDWSSRGDSNPDRVGFTRLVKLARQYFVAAADYLCGVAGPCHPDPQRRRIRISLLGCKSCGFLRQARDRLFARSA